MLKGPGGLTCRWRSCKDSGSTPGQGRSSGEGNGNPFQYSCLENPKNGGAWRATVQMTFVIQKTSHASNATVALMFSWLL